MTVLLQTAPVPAKQSTGLSAVFELSRGSGRISTIEGLRGLAVLLVFLAHYSAIFGFHADDTLAKTLSSFLDAVGHTGVDLFFVLSGYLIYGSLIRAPVGNRVYLSRRIRRIYPTFFAVLLVYLVLSAFFPERSKIPVTPPAATVFILENVLLLPGIFDIRAIITVAWSLSYEFFFYLSIPILVATTGMRHWPSAARLAFFAVLAPVCYLLIVFNWPGRERLVMFIAGIMLCELTNSQRLVQRLHWLGEVGACLLLGGAWFVIYQAKSNSNHLNGLLAASTVSQNYAALMFPCLLCFTLYCLAFQGILSRLLSWKPLRWLGNMSYSFFLIHGLVLNAVSLGLSLIELPSFLQSSIFWLGVPLSMLAALSCSALLFVCIEKPFSLGVTRVAAS